MNVSSAGTVPATPARKPDQEIVQFRIVTVALLAALIGVLAGFAAYGLYHLIGLFTNLFFFQRVRFDLPSLRFHQLGYWVIVLPAVGGFIVSLMAKYGSRKIRGHGIPEAMEAVLFNRSRIAPRVAILKPLSAAISIGTGGPFGAEGPIIQTGGAIGSIFGQAIGVTAAERKVLLACGAAAGMAAIFSTPIAAVILAVELLIFEFKTRSFIPLVIASTLATSIHIVLMGPGPLFDVGAMDFGIPHALPAYLLLGAICGVGAAAYSHALYWFEDMFEKFPFDELWWPPLAGLVLGVIGYFNPRVLGVGYDNISDILAGSLALKVLLGLLVFKALAVLITLGSGMSGGLLAPTFMVSAALGASVAVVINMIFPGAHLSPGAFALCAMGAVFGAAARASFAFIIFAFEITRDYNSVLPLMMVSVIADGIGVLLMRNSIMTEKLVRRGYRVHADYEPDVLQQMNVSDTMEEEFPRIPATMLLSELAGKISRHDSGLMRHQGIPIVNGDDSLVGIITRGDVLKAMERNVNENTTVLDAGTRELIAIYADESLHEAANRMLRHNIGRLPVVERQNPRKIIGYLGRPGILAARLRRIDEEHVRERGWLPWFG